MEEMSKHGHIARAAMNADMDRKTARKYLAAAALPSDLARARTWRTRTDPFDTRWPEVEAKLREAPDLEAKTLLEWLQEQHPGEHDDGQLRTLQRRVRRWRAAHGPEQEVVFGQEHRPGEAAQTDFTWATELGVTIAGQLFVHMLCVMMLPYSNWQWATVCLSESMAALRRGVQRTLFQLGRVPRFHQTDNSTAATHRIPDDKRETLGETKRPFNEDYLALMRHFGMTPRTIEVGAKEQNGDVEASNRAIKHRLEQALLVRGSRDFVSNGDWQSFVDDVQRKANGKRGPRVGEDLAAMRELDVDKLAEFTVENVRVSEWSTVRVKHCAYSVPSRLIGAWVRARIYEDKLEVVYGDEIQLACPRLRGRNLRRIDYRHMIWSMVRKPGAFARYVYREEMFPTVAFRRAYDRIQERTAGIAGDVEYLRILHLAASTMEADVAAAIAQLETDGRSITIDAIKALTATVPMSIDVPMLTSATIDLGSYDALIEAAA
jgi:hypothetical protein